MPTKPLPYETPWASPYGNSVWAKQAQAGVDRMANAGNDVSPALWGGLGKTAATDQDMIGGLLQAVIGAPLAGMGSLAAPLLNALGNLPAANTMVKPQTSYGLGLDDFGADPKAFKMPMSDLYSNTSQGGTPSATVGDVASVPRQATDNLGQKFSDASGYPAERSKELAGLLPALAGGVAAKVGGATEGALNAAGYTAKQAANQSNVFLGLEHFPGKVDEWKEGLKILRDNPVPVAGDAKRLAAAQVRRNKALENFRQKTNISFDPVAGQFRYEVPDNGLEFKQGYKGLLDSIFASPDTERNFKTSFRDIARHPELAKLDPRILDIQVNFDKRYKGGIAQNVLQSNYGIQNAQELGQHVDPIRNLITLGMKPDNGVPSIEYTDPRGRIRDVPTLDSLLNLFTHELDHTAASTSQGFSMGTDLPSNPTPAQWQRYLRNNGESNARLMELRRLLTLDERKAAPLTHGNTFGYDNLQKNRWVGNVSKGLGQGDWASIPLHPRKQY